MKFRRRLLFGFTILAGISVIISLVSIYQLRKIQNEVELILEHPFTVSNSAKEINTHINAIHRTMKDVASASDKDEMSESIKLVSISDSIIHHSFKDIKDRFLGSPAVVEDAYNAYINWAIIRNEVIELSKNGDQAAAIAITKGKGAEYVKALFEHTSGLITFAHNKSKEFRQNSIDTYNNSVYLLTLIFLLLIAASVLIALRISKSVSGPIHQFVERARQLITKQEINKDELLDISEEELLALTLEQVEESYHKLENYHIELERQVEKRTIELRENEEKLKSRIEEYTALNEEYAALNKELIHAKEVAVKSDHLKSAFLANMSHEIRTPMNSILGFSELLMKRNLSEEKKEQYLHLINSGGKRLLTLISDIVDVSKIDANQISLNIEDVNINSIIDDISSQFSMAMNGSAVSIIAEKTLPDKDCFIKTDTTRLMQVLSNLIENAQKFTSEGEIKFGYTDKNEMLEFYVEDSGIGIHPDDHDLVFERFRQVDNDYSRSGSGTGLGLAITKGLVELLGGTIRIDSNIQQGATFYFTIPKIAGHRNVENDKAGSPDIKETRELDLTILIAEDEPMNFFYLQELLEDFDYTLIHAINGKEALEHVKSNKSIKLVLMDIKMPVVNGLEATREIRKLNPTIPIIAQTAYAMEEDKVVALKAGCSDFISKPISAEVLYASIDKCLKKVSN